MFPNILLITIDSLRYDHVVGKNHTAKTPNIDFLINTGINFSNTISSSDSTGISIGSIFTGCFPFRSGITHFTFNHKIPLFTEILKQNNYYTCGTFPDVSFFSKLSSKFDFQDLYVYDKREDWLQLEGGIGKQIISRLDFLKQKSPWFYHVHIMDLHAPFILPSKFNFPDFGLKNYDRMISCIDFWIGKILDQIKLSDTIIIISADHGDYIPLVDTKFSPPDNIQQLLRKGKKIVPDLEPLGVKLFSKTKSFLENQKIQKLKNELSEKELRTLGTRGTDNLFDELLMIPLIIAGKNIPKSKKITNMVRQVDIFPTVLTLVKISYKLENIHGRSLLPLINDQELEEVPAYIETGSRNPKEEGKLIGIRTSKWKFLRTRKFDKKNIQLFDLQNDPYEEKNIAPENPDICSKMEELLSNLYDNSFTLKNEFSKEDDKSIEEELRKLGYL